MSPQPQHDVALPGPGGPRLISVLKVLRDPHAAYTGWFAKHGDPCLIRSYNGDIVLTARPELVRQVFAGDASLFAPFAGDVLTPILGPRTIFSQEGKAHLAERKLLMPPLHGSRMRHYGETIVAATRRAMGDLRPGERVVMQELMMRISLDVIVEAVFGIQGEARSKLFYTVVEEAVARAHPALFFNKATQASFFGLTPWDRFVRARDRMNALIREEIEQRRGHEGEREDILSMLMQARYENGEPITTEHLRDQLVTLLVAGHETTALSLSRAMELLHRHPLELERLREALSSLDLDDPNTVARDPRLKAVCQETLRLYPVLPDALRVLKEPFQLGEVTVPAGYVIAVAATVTHRDPTLYPDPDAFRPERFMERTYRPWEFYPFGGGHRRCAGAAFAMYEMTLVLATLALGWRFELLEPGPVPTVRRNVTMGPATGVRMRLIEPR